MITLWQLQISTQCLNKLGGFANDRLPNLPTCCRLYKNSYEWAFYVGYDDGGYTVGSFEQGLETYGSSRQALRINSVLGDSMSAFFKRKDPRKMDLDSDSDTDSSTWTLSLVVSKEFCIWALSDGCVLFENRTSKAKNRQRLHEKAITGMSLLHNHLVTCSSDGRIKVWTIDVKAGHLRQVGEFVTASGAPLTCLHTLAFEESQPTGEDLLEPNEITLPKRKRQKMLVGPETAAKGHLVQVLASGGQGRGASGLIVAGDIAGGLCCITTSF